MPDSKILWERGSLTASLETAPPPDMVEYYKDVRLGSPGGIRYGHVSGAFKLSEIRNGHFVILRREQKLFGTLGYILRETRAGEQVYRTWYARYFSINSPMKAEGRRRLKMKKRSLNDRSASVIKDLANRFNENPERLRDPDTNNVPGAIIYAYVERDNERSRNFAEIGMYEKLGTIQTIIFSRLRKRNGRPAERLQHEEFQGMRELLSVFYRDHCLYHDSYLLSKGEYYVAREKGVIVAGLQANEELWNIYTVGNRFLDRVAGVLFRSPFIRGRISYENFRFLGIEGIYFRKGHEEAFFRLLEGVLSEKDHLLAMLMVDTRSPEYMLLRDHGRLGPIHSVFGSFSADIYAKFISLEKKEKDELRKRPVYVSIYDNT